MSRGKKSNRRGQLQRRNAWARLPLASAISAVLASAGPVMAQDNEETNLGDILVTAQKREENLQNVPVSITAIGNERIENLHLQDFEDYATFLPSLSYQNGGQGGGSGFQRAYMRGVASGGDGNHSGPKPSVGMYLDEQPITTNGGSLDVHLYDIARVEALAGPQGTLYGASSQSGTVRIITNKPDPAGFEAGYDLQGSAIADGDNGYTAEGFVNIPLSANAAIRLVGWYEKEAGFIDNVAGQVTYPTSGVTIDNTTRVEEDYNDGENYGARAALRVDLSDSWTITPTLMGQEAERNGSYGYRVGGDSFDITRFNPETSKDRWWQAGLTVEGKISNFDLVYAGAYLTREAWTQQDYVDYSFFYDDCCGYGYYVQDDAGNFIDPTQYIWGNDYYKMMSHEIRLSSPVDKPFRIVGGVFFSRYQHDIEQNYLITGLGSQLEVTGWPDTWWLTEQERVDRDYAGFFEATYDFSKAFSVTAGARYFEAENSLRGFFGFGLNNPFFPVLGEPVCFSTESVNGAPCLNLDKEVDENGWSPKVNLTYRLTDNALVYATYSEGFRPGGVNRRGTLPPYKADYLDNYEIGWKTSFAGNTVRLNGAVFYEEWTDFQFPFLGQNSLTQIANAGAAEMTGIEAELTFLPVQGLTISLGAAYIDAELSKPYCGILQPDGSDTDPCPRPPLAPEGQQLPVTPKFKGNLITRYTFDMGPFQAHVQGAVAHVGDRWADLRTAQRDVLGEIEAYTIVNLAAGVEGETYSIELFANNAFDEEGQIDRWAQCDALICGNAGTYITPTAPRTIGLKFAQRF